MTPTLTRNTFKSNILLLHTNIKDHFRSALTLFNSSLTFFLHLHILVFPSYLLTSQKWLIQSVSALSCQSYQWLKEKIISEDGRKQQAKLKELNHIAEKLGCTLPQLAVGKTAVLHYCPREKKLFSAVWKLQGHSLYPKFSPSNCLQPGV